MSDITLPEIQKFLSTPDNPVSMKEFRDFWQSLSDSEKAEYKATIAALKA